MAPSAWAKSKPEARGDALVKSQARGRATLPEAALLMKMSRESLGKYISLGWIRAVQIGPRYYVLPEEIERYKREGFLKP